MKRICLITIITIMTGICTALVFRYNCKNEGIVDIHKIEDIKALNCNVNQIFTEEDVDLFIEDAEYDFSNLSEDAEIYIVSPTNNIIQYDFTMLQQVKINKVIRGESKENETIQLVTIGGIYDQKYRYHEYLNDRPLFYGMTNILFPNNKYLIFVNQLGINRYTEMNYYYPALALFSTFNITSDLAIPIDSPINSIAYNDFKSSEFLCDTQKTIDKILAFKYKIIDKWMKPDF